MKAIIQRVKSAEVKVAGKVIGEIGPGILTFLGIHSNDTDAELEWIIRKIIGLRIFEDPAGKMNLNIKDVGGAHLIVSQFTLYGDCSSGNRPGFSTAARPEKARPLYERAIVFSENLGVPTQSGQFQADMAVSLINDGPVTLILESGANA